MPPTWHVAHRIVVWAPVSAKAVVAWSKLAGLQAVVVWQVTQFWPMFCAAWFGFVVAA